MKLSHDGSLANQMSCLQNFAIKCPVLFTMEIWERISINRSVISGLELPVAISVKTKLKPYWLSIVTHPEDISGP
jgi:hypothetical protein